MRSVVSMATGKPVMLAAICVQAAVIVYLSIILHIYAQNGWLRDSVVATEFRAIRAEHTEQRIKNSRHEMMIAGMAAITGSKGTDQLKLDERVRVLEVKVLGVEFKPTGNAGVQP